MTRSLGSRPNDWPSPFLPYTKMMKKAFLVLLWSALGLPTNLAGLANHSRGT